MISAILIFVDFFYRLIYFSGSLFLTLPSILLSLLFGILCLACPEGISKVPVCLSVRSENDSPEETEGTTERRIASDEGGNYSQLIEDTFSSSTIGAFDNPLMKLSVKELARRSHGLLWTFLYLVR